MVSLLRRKKTSFYWWYKRFHDGREDVEDDERPPRSTRSTQHVNNRWKCEKKWKNGYE
jgi:hypothetical protein